MRRFFVEEAAVDSREVSLRGGELRHLRVLRLREGDEVILFNGKGLELKGVIITINEVLASVKILSTLNLRGESPLYITLLVGLPKAHKADLIVQKATELGVNSIVFYSASRSVPDITTSKMEKKLQRWRRIALGAVKQCGRSCVPEIIFRRSLSEALEEAASSRVKLFFFEGGGSSLGEVLTKAGGDNTPPRSAVVLIGPEGGFTEAEGEEALNADFITIGLGPRILRTETAALVSVALVQNCLGDFS